MILYSCHGAAKEVTGSCHLVRCGEKNVLIDCGLFQGSREVEKRNAEPFGFEPGSVDVLLLTHAHLDHCGRIPRLVREGFRGRILATSATRELARVVLIDAAGLQEEDARRQERAAQRRGEPAPGPLYTLEDAFHALDFFDGDIDYDQDIPVVEGVRARFLDAGHILGAASILLELVDGQTRRRMLFSGDIGSPGRPILRDAVKGTDSDYVVMETTYGDRPHRTLPDSVNELYRAVRETTQRGGNVIVPTFALERAQEVLYHLHRGMLENHISRQVPVFLDSPMAISATEIFRRHPECFNAAFTNELREGDPFAMPALHFSRETTDSMAINQIDGGAVILAGSGMCNGGRVRHHLKHNLWREKCSIVFVGYAAEGSLARRIVDGAHSVSIFDTPVNVRAQVWTINGFSAHADQPALIDWLGDRPRRKVFLVHGEYDRGMSAMQRALSDKGIDSHMPGMHEPILID